MVKAQKNSNYHLLQKIETSPPKRIKRKIIYDIKSYFYSLRTTAKFYGISRNTVNALVIKYSLLTN
ncbi:Transposase [Elizabethkingia anophelis]|uniref:Transposase n=1 Tax=Elizabethkingia anophelis TaxID=1117645 RepID=A0A455ZFL3_9FLAO|nr:TPA_exp: hypothetical protein [Elizabethkingia anophelis]